MGVRAIEKPRMTLTRHRINRRPTNPFNGPALAPRMGAERKSPGRVDSRPRRRNSATRLKRRKVTFRSAVHDVLDDYRLNRRRSRTDVERHVRLHLLPFFGRRRMAAITTADVRRYVARRQDEGAKNATINRELAVVKRAFSLAITTG